MRPENHFKDHGATLKANSEIRPLELLTVKESILLLGVCGDHVYIYFIEFPKVLEARILCIDAFQNLNLCASFPVKYGEVIIMANFRLNNHLEGGRHLELFSS